MPSLNRRLAIVTGATSVIGQAVATAIVRDGGRVIAMDSDKDHLAEVVAKINCGSCEHGAWGFVGNLREGDRCSREVFEYSLREHGMPDTICHLAGMCPDEHFMEGEEEEWKGVVKDCQRGGHLLTVEAELRWMEMSDAGVERCFPRCIVQTAPGSWRGDAEATALCRQVSRSIISASRSMAGSMGPYGIRVNVVAPGPIDAPFWRVLPDDVRKKVLDEIPMGRAASPEEIASAYMYLISNNASFVSGTVINVAGGYS